MSGALDVLIPDWDAPARVRACFTTRRGGVSVAPRAGLNLADHVGDAAAAVRDNRALLARHLELPQAPQWLRQVHGRRILRVPSATPDRTADGAISRATGAVCAVLVADCLPILMCARDGGEVAAVHAGWRGLDAGIIGAAVAAFAAPPAALMAWIGPAIGAAAYRIGPELRERFVVLDPAHGEAFSAQADGWHLDLAALAARLLAGAGVACVSTAQTCVYRDADRYYSFRRDGTTGRMAALIWLAPA